ncbi:hypothetical protein LINGRAHAP2_LOCUS8728 [Linum grandiflorum]
MANFKLIPLLLLPLFFLSTQTADSQPTNKIIDQSDTSAPVRAPTPQTPPPESGKEAATLAAAEVPEAAAEAEERKEQRKRHIDKPVAGGGFILGGFIAALCMAVFCYIRVTRKRDEELLPIVVASSDALVVNKQQKSVLVSSSPSPAPASCL